MMAQLDGLPDVQQITGQPAIQEMEFGRLHHLLADIAVPGWQATSYAWIVNLIYNSCVSGLHHQ
jgi:hypothetical protein